MKNYEGIVLLLEEDYYVSEDTITVLQMLQNLRKKSVNSHILFYSGFFLCLPLLHSLSSLLKVLDIIFNQDSSQSSELAES